MTTQPHRPERQPSPRYIELIDLYRELHGDVAPEAVDWSSVTYAGNSLKRHIPQIRKLIRATQSATVLDYGSGKGSQYHRSDIRFGLKTYGSVQEYWGVDRIHCYDPAYTPYSTLPEERFDGVVSTDVLEHVPQEDLDWVLSEIFYYAKKFVFGNIACFAATQMLPNGENAHCSVLSPEEWKTKIDAAHAASGGVADYCFIVTELRDPRWSLAKKPKRLREHTILSNRMDWR